MESPTIAVIGTGFSGLCAAIQIKKQLGITAQVFEMSDDVGGTWHHNTYPGCACDTPSHIYSFSFELNPDWSHQYCPREEVCEYLRGVARKYNIYETTRFKTEVTRIDWIDEKQMWKLVYRNLDNVQDVTVTEYYNYVFAGLGPLRVPNIPPQFKEFKGTVVHTGSWDSSINFKNKNVAVVGSGASAIQVVPELQKEARHLISYQRSPAWVSFGDQFSFSKTSNSMFKYVPFLMWAYRCFIYLTLEVLHAYFTNYKGFFGRFIVWMFTKLTAHRLNKAGRPDLIPILTPKFHPGCKRITRSDVYLQALAQPNVTVVPSAVKATYGTTIVDENGSTEDNIDILVLATGFNATGFLANLGIYGRNTRSLHDKWAKGYPETYQGTMVHGFPNFFILLGPGVALSHNSVIIMVECQVNYAIKCIKHTMKHNLGALEPTLSAESSYAYNTKKRFDGTVWKSGCDSWYLNADGEVYGLWPGRVTNFWWNTLKPKFKDFIEYTKDI